MSRLIVIIGLVLPWVAQAQAISEKYPIESVQFVGLKKTKASYLSSLLRLQDVGAIDETAIAQWERLLLNQAIIYDLSYRFDTIGNSRQLIFDIKEAKTLFPILNFGGIRNNFWYQVGFNDINWLGRGMQLSAFYRNNDRRHNFNVFYRVPQIGQSKWGTAMSVLKWASVEPLFFSEGTVIYNYDNWSFGSSLYYQFQHNQQLEIGVNYFVESYEKLAEQTFQNSPGPDAFEQPKWLGKLRFHLNNINYNFHQLDGFDNNIILETVYNTIDQNWFFIIWNDLRYFQQFGERSNLALRLRLGISSNQDSPFAPFVLDSNINIRGSGNRIDRGTAQAILNLEYRYDFWVSERFPVVCQGVGFVDFGTWRKPGGVLSDLVQAENIRPFMGGGIRLIYKNAFDTSLRIDYGVDVRNSNERGFVLGFGQYF
ncbi:MAG: BamA/TamA family outer membrane protein [Bacteroidota bacterium]